ncbi:DUF2690 domain-containing protein [Streptomyces olivoreticuli]
MVEQRAQADGDLSPRDLLAAEMRRLKGESQLSYGRLADRTHYSRSSWERFLNGKQLPTRVAVEQFAAAAGKEDPRALLALLDAATERERRLDEEPPKAGEATPPPAGPAEAERPAPAATAPGTAPDSGDDGKREQESGEGDVRGTWNKGLAGRLLRRGYALGLVAAGATAGSLVTVAVLGGTGTGGGDPAAQGGGPQPVTSPSVAPAVGGIKPGCEGDGCLSREPQAMDCHWDATTVRQTWLRGLHIQLRYSTACQAVWGRIENGTVGDSVTIKDKRGLEEQAAIRVGTDTYTRMLAVAGDAPDSVTVCGTIPDQHERECSPVGAVQP